MKWLLGILVLVATLWSGWWMLGAYVADRAMLSWLEERRSAGWAADVATLDTGGYPLRFETEIATLQLADPATGVAFTAPSLILTRPTVAPTDITVTLPPAMTLATPLARFEITSAAASARLSVAPTPDIPLKASAITLDTVAIAASEGWTSQIASAQITTETGEAAFSHVIRADLRDLAPGTPVRRVLDPAGLLPEVIGQLTLDATVTFDAPWDLNAIEQRRPQPRAVTLNTLDMVWGGVEVRVAGAFEVDAAGIPEGDVTVQIVNWQDLLALLQSNGVLPAQINALALRAVEALAQANGRPETLDAPLTLSGGFVRFGPVPIGPAPRLVIR